MAHGENIRSYRDLKAWQAGMEMAEMVYGLSQLLPRQEIHGLTSQIQRAAVSVPSNIAEGHARDSTKEFLRFVSIALGSLAELETQFLLIARLHYLDENDMGATMLKIDETGKLARGLQKSLKRKISSTHNPQPPAPSPQPLAPNLQPLAPSSGDSI